MIILYISTLAGSREINKQQKTIKDLLHASKIEFTEVDVASSLEDKEKMRELTGDPTSLPPQIANGTKYCGNYEVFMEAVENLKLEQFLQISGKN